MLRHKLLGTFCEIYLYVEQRFNLINSLMKINKLCHLIYAYCLNVVNLWGNSIANKLLKQH